MTIVVVADVLMCVRERVVHVPRQSHHRQDEPRRGQLSRSCSGLRAATRSSIPPRACLLGSAGQSSRSALSASASCIELQSVQGYSSAVAGSYQLVTGAHDVENLQPVALTRSDLDILNLKELVTLPEYLVEEVPETDRFQSLREPPSHPEPRRRQRHSTQSRRRSRYPASAVPPLARTVIDLDVARPDRARLGDGGARAATTMRLPEPSRSAYSMPKTRQCKTVSVTVLRSQVQVSLKGQEAYGIRLGASNATPVSIGAVAVTTVHPMAVNSGPLTRRLVLNQVLQGVLEPPHWRYQTEIGGLSVFTNTLARGASWIEPAGSKTPLAPELPAARELRLASKDGKTRRPSSRHRARQCWSEARPTTRVGSRD